MTTRKIDFLINTHHHGDHTSGNIVFRPAAAKIVAHRNVPALQKTQAADAKSEAQQAYADTTYDTTWSAKVGSETVSLKYYGPGHTSGDSVVTFQNANIVHMGDLMFYLRNPRVDRAAGRVDQELDRHAGSGREGTSGRHDLHRRPLEGEPADHGVARRAPEVPRLLHRPARLRAERASRRADRQRKS